MINKKGQGISFSYIVVAAIAIIVLVLVAFFLFDNFEDSSDVLNTITNAQFSTITIERSNCQTYCIQAKSRVLSNIAQWQTSQYCSAAYSIDINGNERIDEDLGEKDLKCWSSEGAFVLCSAELTDGTPVNHLNCTN